MARQEHELKRAAPERPELAQSGPVFDRARRLAAAMFGRGAGADIVLVDGDAAWRSCDPDGHTSVEASGVRACVDRGELIWCEDLADHPELQARARDYGAGEVRAYVAVPIRLECGEIPGALVVGGREPRAHDPELAARLQDLADFVADEWARARALRARERSARERDVAHRTLAAVVESAPVSIALTDRDMRLTHASPIWLKNQALTAEQAIGRSIYELAPEVFEPWRKSLERCLQGNTLYAEKAATPRPDGSTALVQARVAPWRDADGEVGGLVMIAHDMSEVYEAFERVTTSEERLKLAVEMARLHVWEVDLEHGTFSPTAGQPIVSDTLQIDDSAEHNPWRNVDSRDAPRVRAAWRRARDLGEPFETEYRVTRGDGRQLWVAARARTVRDQFGKPVRLVGAVQDITAIKSQEQALLEAKNAAEAANRAKSAFLATISHEIRTPLNGLMGMVQVMSRGELDPVQRDRLEVIRSSSEGLLAILNELLDLSKIEAGKLTLEDGELDIGELATAACATFQAIADTKGVSLAAEISRAARGEYRGDPLRVRQILHNLVSNALKFTDRGEVRIMVSRRAGKLQIEVADSGIGMTEEQQKNLFRAFQQAEASTSRRYGGTGLGLAICHDLVELMGGRISVRSAAGEGTSFIVRLPLEKVERQAPAPETQPAEPAADPAERPLRVLAAEDNSVNQLVLKTLLNQAHIEPTMVGDGRAAVEAWRREPWDLILMDVQMPGMDGPTATAQIRALEKVEGRRRTPIIALTANAMDDQVAEYLAAGMDGHVAKPIAASRLFAALQQALGGVDEADAEAAA